MSTQHSFNINIFVAEGRPDGLRLVEKTGWVGLGIICPRSRYTDVKGRDEFSRPAVYILEGEANDGDQPLVYIGEAETVRVRLDRHYVDKDFWQRAVIFTTNQNPLNKSEVKYLEASLLERVENNGRCRLDNEKSSQKPALSEAQQADVEGYLREMLFLLPAIGINFFEPMQNKSDKQKRYFFKGKRGEWSAEGYETGDGFIVCKGGIARGRSVPSVTQSYKNKISILMEDGILIKKGNGFSFTKDCKFSSPSQAATICGGANYNGLDVWKDANDVTLKDNREREVKT